MRTTRRKAAAPLCISSNEMERLRSFTRPPPKKEEDLRNEHLKKLSEDRVKNWPNTLAAQRKISLPAAGGKPEGYALDVSSKAIVGLSSDPSGRCRKGDL